jgi:hypothetical protein
VTGSDRMWRGREPSLVAFGFHEEEKVPRSLSLPVCLGIDRSLAKTNASILEREKRPDDSSSDRTSQETTGDEISLPSTCVRGSDAPDEAEGTKKPDVIDRCATHRV